MWRYTQLDGAALHVDVELEDNSAWYCSALYDNQSVPCFASFDPQDEQTYIFIDSDLGLSTERYQQFAKTQVDSGWSEQDWLRMAIGIVFGLSIVVMVVLWRHSGKRSIEHQRAGMLFRFIYVFGIGSMVFFVTHYVSLLVLLLVGVVD